MYVLTQGPKQWSLTYITVNHNPMKSWRLVRFQEVHNFYSFKRFRRSSKSKGLFQSPDQEDPVRKNLRIRTINLFWYFPINRPIHIGYIMKSKVLLKVNNYFELIFAQEICLSSKQIFLEPDMHFMQRSNMWLSVFSLSGSKSLDLGFPNWILLLWHPQLILWVKKYSEGQFLTPIVSKYKNLGMKQS